MRKIPAIEGDHSRLMALGMAITSKLLPAGRCQKISKAREKPITSLVDFAPRHPLPLQRGERKTKNELSQKTKVRVWLIEVAAHSSMHRRRSLTACLLFIGQGAARRSRWLKQKNSLFFPQGGSSFFLLTNAVFSKQGSFLKKTRPKCSFARTASLSINGFRGKNPCILELEQGRYYGNLQYTRSEQDTCYT